MARLTKQARARLIPSEETDARRDETKRRIAKMYFIEIHFKRGRVPLIQYVRTEADAERLFNAAAHGWILRRYGKDGVVIREGRQ